MEKDAVFQTMLFCKRLKLGGFVVVNDMQLKVIALLVQLFDGAKNAAEILGFIAQGGNVEHFFLARWLRHSKFEHVGIHQVVNHLEPVADAMLLHAMLQVEADGHNKSGVVGNFYNLILQFADQNILVLWLVNGPMFSKNILVSKQFLP